MQKGFSYIALLVAVVVLGVVGFAGWRVVSSDKAAQEAAQVTAPASTQSNETPVQAVDNTVKEVDAIVVDDPALDQIEAELDY
jgi:predicted negative regulator of RcsB-dependent stress response